jgi:hypothetical protein
MTKMYRYIDASLPLGIPAAFPYRRRRMARGRPRRTVQDEVPVVEAEVQADGTVDLVASDAAPLVVELTDELPEGVVIQDGLDEAETQALVDAGAVIPLGQALDMVEAAEEAAKPAKIGGVIGLIIGHLEQFEKTKARSSFNQAEILMRQFRVSNFK